jgi:ribonuclease HI
VTELSLNRERELKIFTDGGARGNPGPAASSCVIKDSAGKVRLLSGKYLGKATNNFAEYRGIILAYDEIAKIKGLDFSSCTLNFNSDSKLVVNQLNGTFRVKDKNIRQLVVKIREYEGKFSKVVYSYVPREQNKIADRLVNEELDKHTIYS